MECDALAPQNATIPMTICTEPSDPCPAEERLPFVHVPLSTEAARQKAVHFLEEKTSTEEAYLAQPEVECTAEIREDIPSSEVAEVIWNRLKSYGWSDAVCAGILGNIMAEVGGQSFDILYSLDVGGYYGICMWYKEYSPDVVGRDIYGQCDYIRESIQSQFDYCGEMFGWTMEDFFSLESPEEAALAFAKVYERCTSASYAIRQVNARKAYERFA